MADNLELFDEFGNITPEAEIQSRVYEAKQNELAAAAEAEALRNRRAQVAPPTEMDKLAAITRAEGGFGVYDDPDAEYSDQLSGITGDASQAAGTAESNRDTVGLIRDELTNPRTASAYLDSPKNMEPYFHGGGPSMSGAPEQAPPSDYQYGALEEQPQQPQRLPGEGAFATGTDPVAPLLNELRERQKDELRQMEAITAMQEGGERMARQRMEQLSMAYREADEDLASLKIDPRRWEEQTPTLTKALLLMGAGFFGFLTKGRGPNPLLNIIDRAIQKDVDAQMVNVKNKIAKSNMKVKGAEALNRAQAAMETALLGRSMSVLQRLQMATTHEKQNIELQLAQKALADRYKIASMKHLAAVQSTVESQMPTMRKVDPLAAEKMNAFAPFLGKLEDLSYRFQKASDETGPQVLTQYIPNTEADKYGRIMDGVAYEEAIFKSGKQMAQKEQKIIKKTYPGSLDSQATAKEYFLNKFDFAIDQMENYIKAYDGKADLRKYKEDLAKAKAARARIAGVKR